MDTDSFVLSIIIKNVIEDLQNHEDLFDFSNLKNIMKKNKKYYR